MKKASNKKTARRSTKSLAKGKDKSLADSVKLLAQLNHLHNELADLAKSKTDIAATPKPKQKTVNSGRFGAVPIADSGRKDFNQKLAQEKKAKEKALKNKMTADLVNNWNDNVNKDGRVSTSPCIWICSWDD